MTADDYAALLDALDQGFCVLEIIVDDRGEPADYRFVQVNARFEQQTGLVDAVGKTARSLVPDLEQGWVDVYGRVALTGESTRFTQQSEAMGRWFAVHAVRVGTPDQRRVALLFTDISAEHRERDARVRAEAALRDSDIRSRAFVDAAPAMLWSTEVDGYCSFLSRGWYEFTGQSETEALGFGWIDAVHPAQRQQAERLFLAANSAHQSFSLEHKLRRHDGAYRWVIDAGRPRFDADGTFAGFVGSVIDIHERKLIEQRLDLAVSSGRVGLWHCDLPFSTLVWNAKVKEHFGLPPDATVTIDTFYEWMHPADREPTRQAIEHAIATHATYDVEYRTQGPDGHLRWVRAIGHAQYEDDVPVRFDGITIDITELVRLRTEAEAASRAKDEFLAMLGHELRNPLAPIRTALELLKMRGIAAIEHERAVIERQVANLVRLVDDLLDVARIARGRIALTRRPVHLAEIIARAVETVSPLLEKQRHLLDVFVAPDLVLDADEARLTQVVANLLSNAAKYTPPGGRVSVSAFADQGAVHISIADNGVGIDEALQATVFDTFVQGERQLARSEGGLGLGLAIVRNLVELHEGVVTVHSAGPGHGSTFTIRLPQGDRRAADLEAARGTANGPAAGDAARVLIVDDNEDAAQMLAAILESEGYATATAADGPSALAAARLSVPAIALVDIGLPLMDGYQLARHFKEDAELMKVPLVALTGYGQDQDRQQSAAAGFAAHLVKPVDLDRLRAVVEAFLTGTGTT